ncbi:winged helix-turn-helix transcriptional regulator [Haloarchaeobius iranensis]|uniref:DNA-binding transcriptional regulator, HxlR family n=1 Tax=Haloarchaeobius iranensis TaxID=996166 RepID=A0A1H0B5Z5_9EURY|nr:helix-turn-helix domain-containing protein [Haloarchaeobius iranensis]SDN41075.1 DNA-binding transcriptional regulator, HxlR family [Haloarchaeobius iranensis]
MRPESTTARQVRPGGTNGESFFVEPPAAFDEAQEVVGRKWHLRIVYQLLEHGPMGFNALEDRVVGVSSKMLSESLSRLEDDGVVDRDLVSDQPLRVAYSLTERGAALEPVVWGLLRWSVEHGPAEDA